MKAEHALEDLIGRVMHSYQGSTHWEGCEERHPLCAEHKLAREAIELLRRYLAFPVGQENLSWAEYETIWENEVRKFLDGES